MYGVKGGRVKRRVTKFFFYYSLTEVYLVVDWVKLKREWVGFVGIGRWTGFGGGFVREMG